MAVVTGAARGIGQVIATSLAGRGATVVGVDVEDQSATVRLVAETGGSWHHIAGDIGSPDDVARIKAEVLDRFGGCDILVNNAAITDPIEWDELTYERWQQVLQVNLFGAFLMCKSLVPVMSESGWGRIVNITSGSVVNPMPRFVAYRAAKMGLIGLTRALAISVGERGITVNAVAPAVTRTAMASSDLSPEFFEEAARRQAIKRVAEPKDLMGTILFLTGEESYWVTGQTIYANGGGAFS